MTAPDAPGDERPLIAHLLELRARLVKGVVAVLVAFGVAAFFSNPLYALLAKPLLATLPAGSQLIATDPLTPFSTPLRLALYVAVLAAAPVLIYQLWAFIAPGLYRRERRLAAPMLVSSILLFYAGCAFAYYVLLPAMFRFIAFTRPEAVALMPDIARYLDFVAVIALASGLGFELPVAITLCAMFGWVTPAQLRQGRGYAVIGIAVVAMLITPGDGLSMLLMMAPMYLLYEAGIIAAGLVMPRPDDATA